MYLVSKEAKKLCQVYFKGFVRCFQPKLNKQWKGYKKQEFLVDFDYFCMFFELYYFLAEKQRTKLINTSSLTIFASLDTQGVE